MADYQEKKEALVKKSLEKWKGAEVLLWEYQVSHKMLTIRLQVPNRSGNLHISCGDTQAIHGPTSWPSSQLQLVRLDAEGDTIYHIRDDAAGFRVECGLVNVQENVKPVF